MSREMIDRLKKQGIAVPTPIQEQAVPVIMDGQDVMGQAQTGTGKTFAFVVPILEKMDPSKPHVQALIISPTRELALQITEETKRLAPEGVHVLPVYGGQDTIKQLHKLEGTVHIIVATPGRLLDHLRRETVDLNQVDYLVIDEADQMLEAGFYPDVMDILDQTNPDRQSMLFSATLPSTVKKLGREMLREPKTIHVKPEKETIGHIKQLLYQTTDRAKQDALITIMQEHRPFLAVIFCRTKRRAKKLNDALLAEGFLSDELHGDLTQAKRQKVMKRFREADIQYLVATDVAARGLDVEGVTHVFNYDIPQDADSYIHRIGRTGRAGGKGLAITFAAPKDKQMLNIIEKQTKQKLERRSLDSLSPGKREKE
ncbi:DEAD/DEAH box helicase [Halobacillus litoralis]|uniref:DEAD/DEAH box helicase n=1 Tax=Halobacillus litoralis TaxID=45668 RepID=UPI00136ECCB7|nr:DEAD/DEAH box helicase [Halobacillus litoralis]MCA1024128.1 DEAD/DEAH box helicase [Halobacillus litoralis]MYL38321.1 DEAD/DEAH box helicase [Halobacillus litoralis]